MGLHRMIEGGHSGVGALNAVVSRFRRDDTGATAIEYTLIAGIIGLTVIAAAQALSTSLSGTYSEINSEVDGAI